MESNKHNDELIKRKLADVSVEPRKLKFAEVHANYEKARKSSSNKWGLYFFTGIIAIALVVSTYLLLTPFTQKTLADNSSVNTSVSNTSSTNSDEANFSQQKVQSVGTTTEDKYLEKRSSETPVSENVNEESSPLNDVKETSAEKASNETELKNSNIISSNNKTNSGPTDKEELTKNKTYTKTNSNKKESGSEMNSSTKSTAEKKSETKVGTNSSKNSNSAHSVKNNSKTNSNRHSKENEDYIAAANKKDETKTVVKGKTGTENSTGFEKSVPTKKQTETSAKYSEKNSEVGNSTIADNNGNNTSNSSGNSNAINNENTKENDSNAAIRSNNSDQKENSKNENYIKDENSDSKTAQTGTVVTSSTVVTKNKPEEEVNSEAIGSGSVSPRNKHQFLLSTELSYSSISYETKANPKASSQFNQGEPGFVNTYANAMGTGKYKLFNGSAFISYMYNEGFGISTGIGFFSIETKINTQGFGTKKNTTIIDSLVHGWDSINGWHVVDTTFKNQTSSNYAVVNGDSVKNQDYLNNIRFYTIPFKLHYNIKCGPKFSIEPQAGILMAVPLNSNQLVATRAYAFEYKKTNNNLNPRIMYFDLSLKLGYKISNNAQLYIKEGYFFRNRSIYNEDYPLDLSLKSLYTSFGIAIRLK